MLYRILQVNNARKIQAPPIKIDDTTFVESKSYIIADLIVLTDDNKQWPIIGHKFDSEQQLNQIIQSGYINI